MQRAIRESDWKLFRKLHSVALERFCNSVLEEVRQIVADNGTSSPERYAALFGLIKQRDKELAGIFDDMQRSTALFQLAMIQSQGLLTDDEFAQFSSETRDSVQRLLEVSGRHPGPSREL